jgi:nucleotide-binding universal stress UspA family protein
MHPIKHILLPTDFSLPSAEVARYVAALAGHFHARVSLLHALGPIDPAWVSTGSDIILEELESRKEKEAENQLKLFSEDELAGCEVTPILLPGDPAIVITEYVRTEHVDLVMMPTRGRGMFRRFLLGSVAAKVLHDTHCAVWTLPHATEGHCSASSVPNVIVCALGSRPAGDIILHWASELAAEFGSRLIVVHAVAAVEFYPEISLVEGDMRSTTIEDAQKNIREVLHGSRTPTAEVRVVDGSVSGVIRTVADERADLLIIGRATDQGVTGRLRTHSYAIIRESYCPVLSV